MVKAMVTTRVMKETNVMKATNAMKATQAMSKVKNPVKAPGAMRTFTKPMKETNVMKATNAMKATQAMSKVKKVSKAMKLSIRLQKSRVFRGALEKTVGGLKKADLTKTRTGKIVSSRASAHAVKVYPSTLANWTQACMKAREALGIEGFVLVKKGSALYKVARELYKS